MIDCILAHLGARSLGCSHLSGLAGSSPSPCSRVQVAAVISHEAVLLRGGGHGGDRGHGAGPGVLNRAA